jgi:hypothetical protein
VGRAGSKPALFERLQILPGYKSGMTGKAYKAIAVTGKREIGDRVTE